MQPEAVTSPQKRGGKPMLRISKEDKRKVDLNMRLTDAIVSVKSGKWVISTPGETLIYDTTEDMMEDINYNLEEIRKAYEAQGELHIWEEAQIPQEKRTYAEIRAERLGKWD